MTGELSRAALPSGVELHYLQGGAGEPLVFVHGVMGDWESWAPQWPAFCARYRCTTYSRRYNHPNHNEMASPDHSALVEAEGFSGAGAVMPVLPVMGLRNVLGELAAAYYGLPSDSMQVVGVTGTNGKTSTASWIAQLLSRAGR